MAGPLYEVRWAVLDYVSSQRECLNIYRGETITDVIRENPRRFVWPSTIKIQKTRADYYQWMVRT